MLTFSIPGSHLARLKLLPLLIGKSERSALAHIHLRITATDVRFTVTDGKCLMMVLARHIDPIMGNGKNSVIQDILLDGAQFLASMTMLAKAKARTVFFSLADAKAKQLQCGFGSTQCLITVHYMQFPNVSHVISQGAKASFEYATGHMDPKYLSLAQKVSGWEKPLMFAQSSDGCARGAWWSDSSLAVLIMYITRPEWSHVQGPNLAPFDLPLPEVSEFPETATA